MIVEMDDVLQMKLAALKAWLLQEHTLFLRLFTNGIVPSPASQNPSAYVEATYGGYAPLGIFGLFGDPFREDAGIWRIEAPLQAFNANTGTFAQAVSGWYIQRGPKVIHAEQFPQPVNVAAGALGPSILLRLKEEAKSVIISSLSP